MRNHEVTREQKLLNYKGEINEAGWARKPVWRYNREDIKVPKIRIKEWDYYIVIHDGKYDGTESFAAAFTISDDGYVGLQSVSLINLDEENPSEHTETLLNVLPMGRLSFPKASYQGNVWYGDKRLKMRFIKKIGKRQIQCKFKDFVDGKLLEANVRLLEPEMESVNILTPWNSKGSFYLNQKVNCLRASGEIRIDGKSYKFNPEYDFGTLDWGRGVWTYDNTWYWGNGNTVVDGHTVGFNIGYGFGDTSKATENMLIIDGVVHKLDDVDFGIPGDKSLKDMKAPDYMSEWKITSSDGRFEMNFRPVFDRSAKIDYFLIVSDQHQVFGRMTGFAVTDKGETLEFKDVLCFAEKVHNRY